METAYTMAMGELARRREENKEEQQRRLSALRQQTPRYGEIEAGLMGWGTKLARCVLDGKSNIDEIKTAITNLRAEREGLLRSMGLSADYIEDIYTCENCKDTGFDALGKRCGCLEQLILRYTGQGSNLTEYMREQTFEKVDYSLFAKQPAEKGRDLLQYMKRVYATGKRFAETFDQTKGNLLLMGNAGTGKTYLSSCIANLALSRGKTVYYQSAFRLFDLLERLKFGRCQENEIEEAEAVSRQIAEADLLVLDDLGTEFISAYSTAALFDLVNTRQIQGKSTLLSTNLSFDGLEQLYSKRLTSRLWGDFEIIRFLGQDLRMQKRMD